MGQRHDAIDIVETGKAAFLIEVVGYVTRHGRRTVHRGNDADIVARAGTARATIVPHEGPALSFWQHALFFDVDAELVCVLGWYHGKIVQVDVAPCLDVLRGNANHLTIFDHLFAGLDRLQGHLVPAPDQIQRLQVSAPDIGVFGNGPTGHCNIVLGVQQNGSFGILSHSFPPPDRLSAEACLELRIDPAPS